MKASVHSYTATACMVVVSLLFYRLASLSPIPVCAQEGCTEGDTPATASTRLAWLQNTTVRVNINSSQFTQDQFNNCIVPLFEEWNLINGRRPEDNGNASGVRFNVTYSTDTVASIDSGLAVNASGVDYGF